MIRRRIFAAVALMVFAVGSALYWNDWRIEPVPLGLNVLAAVGGFIFLHYRWKRREARAMTPNKAKDVFS